jgi:hypothetical protein
MLPSLCAARAPTGEAPGPVRSTSKVLTGARSPKTR